MYRGKKLFDFCDDRINKMEMYLICFFCYIFFGKFYYMFVYMLNNILYI